MSAVLISIKRGAAKASSAFSTNSRSLLSHPAAVGSFLYSNRREQLLHKSQFVEPYRMCAFKVDTLPMVRRMEAQSKLQSELKSDQVKLLSELKSDQDKKMWYKSRADIHVDAFRAELKEIQKIVRDGCIAAGLVLDLVRFISREEVEYMLQLFEEAGETGKI